jgi:hypothetical protein
MRSNLKSGKQGRRANTKVHTKNSSRRKRRGRELCRFNQFKGKTVDFVEISSAYDFPCIEIGFQDKTALHFLLTIDPHLTMEPTYSDWKTGNRRVLKRWQAIKCRLKNFD